MKKIITFVVISIFIVFLGFYIYQNHHKLIKNNPISNFINKVSNKKEDDALNNKIDKILENMTLEEKIAQMLIIDLPDKPLTEDDYHNYKNLKPGGFIFFSENITTYEKTLEMVKKLKETADIPLFIAIDEEGGKVARLDSLQDISVTKIPSMYELGQTADDNIAYEVGKITANKLRVFGFNLDFAPCADIYSNPDNTVIGYRSFGSNPAIVSSMTTSFARGLEENGITAAYKHFPGHGDTAVDSHLNLPIIEKSLTEMQNLELIPFQKAISNNAQMIMIGHLAVPEITGDTTPASLSSKIISDLLKEQMGYQNLVITDSLKMGAITSYYTEEELYPSVINAGVDILLMPKNAENALRIIKENVTLGNITEERINSSVRKILKHKYKYLEKNYHHYLPSSYLNDPLYDNILKQIN